MEKPGFQKKMADETDKRSDTTKLSREEHFHVCIFGSARIKKGDPEYDLVQQLSRMIASEGIDVVTGGGPGLMEAANSGHRLGRLGTDTHSVGYTIKLPKEQMANTHLDIKKDFSRFSNRLDSFMLISNAMVVAPGGVGTLLEFMYAWQLIQVKQVCDIPIILLGDMWSDFMDWVKHWPLRKGLISDSDMSSLFIVQTSEEAMEIIKKRYDEFNEGSKDFCLTYKKYRID